MDEYSLAVQTMFAELLAQSLDAEFDEYYTEQGNFKRRKKSNRYYWYFNWDAGGRKHERYVGPVKDASITDRVQRFEGIKQNYRSRRQLVRALTAAGMQMPIPPTGEVVEALWKAGFFRLRGVLVGTIAYSCYEGILGTRLSSSALRTEDADFAQYWGISNNIGESIPPPLKILRDIDPSFREIPDIIDPFVTSRYVNSRNFKVEFLTPNRGSDDFQSRPAKMKALGDTGAQPLRHLDYLIYQPEKSVMLHSGGIPVSIPRAERYAVHKLIVAVERRNQAKAAKDIAQAAELIGVLALRRPLELGEAWEAAWATGPRWQEKLEAGRARLAVDALSALNKSIDRARDRASRTARSKAVRASDRGKRTSESDISLAVLRICAVSDDGIASFADIRKFMPQYVTLSKEDLRASETRKGEPLWQQVVRNIVSHRHVPGNIVAEGYAVTLPGALKITQAGLDYLYELSRQSEHGTITRKSDT